MNVRTALIATTLLTSLSGVSTSTWAVPINFEVTGSVTSADSGNPFGLVVDDMIVITAMFDDDLIDDMGTSTVEFGFTGNAFDSMLTIAAGSITLSQTNDTEYLTNFFPSLTFTDRKFDFIDFSAELGENDSPATLKIFSSGVIEGQGIGGTINAEQASITPKTASVPEPGVLALLAFGLAGLAYRRHERS